MWCNTNTNAQRFSYMWCNSSLKDDEVVVCVDFYLKLSMWNEKK